MPNTHIKSDGLPFRYAPRQAAAHVQRGVAYGCANQAIGPRCPLRTWAFGPRMLWATGQRRITPQNE
ncbi:MAG: hypothetical protein WA974_07185 [Thermodesulfobacteriota bacterium]